MTHSLMSSTAAVRIALQEIAVAEAEAVLCVLRAKKQLAQARLDASLAHDSYLTPAETLPASTLSSPSSASSLTTDSDSHSASPVSDDFLLPPPFISSSVKRSRAIDTWTVTDSVSGGTYRSESVCQYVFEFVCSVEFLPCGQEFSDVRDSRNACVAFGLLGFEVRMVGLEIATLWCANSSQPSSLTL